MLKGITFVIITCSDSLTLSATSRRLKADKQTANEQLFLQCMDAKKYKPTDGRRFIEDGRTYYQIRFEYCQKNFNESNHDPANQPIPAGLLSRLKQQESAVRPYAYKGREARIKGKIMDMVSKKEANDEDIQKLHAEMEEYYKIGDRKNNYGQLRRICGAMFNPTTIFMNKLEENASIIANSFRQYLVATILDAIAYDTEAQRMVYNCWHVRIAQYSKIKFAGCKTEVAERCWVRQMTQWLKTQRGNEEADQ